MIPWYLSCQSLRLCSPFLPRLQRMVVDFRRPPQFVSRPCWQNRGKTSHVVCSSHPIPSHPTQRMQRTSCLSATEVPRRKHLTTFVYVNVEKVYTSVHFHVFDKFPNLSVDRFQQFCLWGQDPPNTRRARSRWTIPGSVLVTWCKQNSFHGKTHRRNGEKCHRRRNKKTHSEIWIAKKNSFPEVNHQTNQFSACQVWLEIKVPAHRKKAAWTTFASQSHSIKRSSIDWTGKVL